MQDKLKIEEVHFHSGDVVKIFFEGIGLVVTTNEAGLKYIEKLLKDG